LGGNEAIDSKLELLVSSPNEAVDKNLENDVGIADTRPEDYSNQSP